MVNYLNKLIEDHVDFPKKGIIFKDILPVLQYPDVFREYEFTIGGQGGNLEPFTKYQLKIVMKSFQQQAVPSFRDLRVISMGT